MSVFRADPAGRKALRLAAAGLFSIAALPALAQEPVRLIPSDPVPQVFRPVGPAPRVPDGIEVRELKAASIESVGVLDSGSGGFSRDMWAGTPAAVVRALMPRLPGATGSVVMRDLARRLLLTAAIAPEGADIAAATGGPTLVGMRAERLLALGDAEGMTALAAATPGAAGRPLLGRVAIDGLMAAGKIDQACTQIGPALSGGYDAALARVQVFCHFAAGRSLEGNLALDLLREAKAVDPAFVAAAEALSGLPPVPVDKLSLAKPDAVHIATFAAAKQPLPADALAGASPAVLAAMARAAGLPLEQRLVAAERAESLGVISAEVVRKLYAEASLSPADLSSAIPTAESGDPRGAALLYRAAADMSDEGVRAQLVAAALDHGARNGMFASTARIFQPLLSTIRPAPENAAMAAVAARALIASGKPEAAAKWYDVVLAAGDRQAAGRLWPLTALQGVGGGGGIDLTGYAAWRASQEGVAPELFARRAALLLGTMAGLGARIPDAAWLDAMALPAGGPSPALFSLMQGGALDARAGITVLASLAAIGEVPLDKADPLAVSEAVSALTVVGLAGEARALAVEVLLANGM